MVTRIILIDLLVERSEFGHGGNQEVVYPIAKFGPVEVILLTPQMQSEESGFRAEEEGLVPISVLDVPKWDDEFPFWQECKLELAGNTVNFGRFSMPLHGDDERTADWIQRISPDAVICSGSRRNVSTWEGWMSGAASLLRSSSMTGIPTLGICFGHQLLCKSLGANVERADRFSSGVWDLELTDLGKSDVLFSSRRSGLNDSPVALYSHQDHVTSVPDNCTLLGSANHNKVTAVRVNDNQGKPLQSWGVQFHPEAARARVNRAFEWGHITKEELDSFQRDHDGAGVLSSFASVVQANLR